MLHEVQTRAMVSNGQSKHAGMPGGWQAFAVTACVALITISWHVASEGSNSSLGAGSDSLLDEVSPQDLSAALDTVAGTSQQLTRFRDRDACGHRLARVTIAPEPSRQSGRIRLQSGSYISPAFELMETPVSIALPYPAPYAIGHGVISVVGATTAALVALHPPWHVPAQAGVETRKVTWTPAAGCGRSGQ